MRILKFEASWCGPCKQLSQTLSTMDIPYPIEVIDIDQNREAAMEYGIRGVPHMILLDENNNIVVRVGGAVSKQQLEKAFNL